MLPLPNNILTGFGNSAEDALWCVYCSTPDHKNSNVTSTDLILALAIKVEGTLGRAQGDMGEAIYEVLNRHNSDSSSHGMRNMARVISRGGWVHELLGIPRPDKKAG